MAENSKIQWTDHTFNPWRGCTKVSDGCKNCYADSMSKRNPAVLGVWGKNGTRVIASEAQWKLPLKWNKEAEASGVRKRVFCASLADVFEWKDTMPEDAWDSVMEARSRLFELIDATKNLDWLLLTKRPEKVRPIMSELSLGTYGEEIWNFRDHMPNIWIGTTVENQEQADKRIPDLLKIPAAVRFLSCEPLLGLVNLEHIATGHWAYGQVDVLSGYLQGDQPDAMYDYENDPSGWTRNTPDKWKKGKHTIDWIIVGGESGGGARPCDISNIRLIAEQCKAADVPVFVKQLGTKPFLAVKGFGPLIKDKKGGDINEWPDDLRVRQIPQMEAAHA